MGYNLACTAATMQNSISSLSLRSPSPAYGFEGDTQHSNWSSKGNEKLVN